VKPNFAKIWAAFPDHVRYPTLRDLYAMLGGSAANNIDVFGPNGNTCASRMSVAFNRGGSPINARMAVAVGAKPLSTRDRSVILFRVEHFRKYLVRALGQPTIDNVSPYDSAFRGRRGIIVFSVHWQGATGHVALWNGLTYREPDHDDYSRYVDPGDPRTKTYRGEFWALA
jgi:hypothetical protein